MAKIFFTRRITESDRVASELWVSDGTATGTHLVQALGAIAGLTAYQGGVVYANGDTQVGVEFWTSDGTPAGMHLVADLFQTQSVAMP